MRHGGATLGLIAEQIARAQERAVGFPLEASLAAARAELPPAEVASRKVLDDRRDFLRETIPDPIDAEALFERIISGNELQDVAYLERGYRVSRAVCRVQIRERAGNYATGFLITPELLITNHHVFPDRATAATSTVTFDYEVDTAGNDRMPTTFALDAADFFYASDALDFAVVKLGARRSGPMATSAAFGFLPLVARTGKVAEGEWLTIIQHPAGERKQVCVRENRLIGRTPDALWYSTDTLGGSSGSPVFNNDWDVVALHHSGVPERDGAGRIVKLDGSPYVEGVDRETDIKWRANEGIRVSRIVAALRQRFPDEPLLGPVLRGTEATTPPPPPTLLPTPEESTMTAQRTIHVAITIDDEGNARFEQTASGADEAFDAFEKSRKKQRAPKFDVPFDFDYSKRPGYQADFLGKGEHLVGLPVLSDALALEAAPLIKAPKDNVLKYLGMSVVMHAKRRWAIYSAANVDFAQRFALSRPTDNWRTDPRILATHQVGEFYYSRNQFDRGHLTRREDMEFGATRVTALQQAADTCHFTNATPQHARFNQSKALWQGLERHILEDSIERDNFRATVFTGPILREDDPIYERAKEIQYPVRFWKVAVAKTDKGKLFAAAFILDQSDVIAKFGIEATDIPFGAFKTFQVPVAEVERLTDLRFVCGADGKTDLKSVDPLATASSRSRRRGPRLVESMGDASMPENYVPLDDLDALIGLNDGD
ncbi:MAG: DNA/RNA non-specific endonuclease [Sphingomonadaceae bacterium]